MSDYQQIFIYFMPVTELLLDVRAMTMENKNMSYIEGVLVKVYKDDVLIDSGLTDANGTWKTYLAAGIYRIELSKDGYYPVTKNETLTRNTELMVNCPTKLAPFGYSGITKIFMTEAVGNPTLTTIADIKSISTRKTCSVQLLKQITRNVTDSKGAAKICSMSTSYEIIIT